MLNVEACVDFCNFFVLCWFGLVFSCFKFTWQFLFCLKCLFSAIPEPHHPDMWTNFMGSACLPCLWTHSQDIFTGLTHGSRFIVSPALKCILKICSISVYLIDFCSWCGLLLVFISAWLSQFIIFYLLQFCFHYCIVCWYKNSFGLYIIHIHIHRQ